MQNCFQKKIVPWLLIIISSTHLAFARSVHRTPEKDVPTIVVNFEGSTQKSILRSHHLEEYPFFQIFDLTYFNNHLLKPSNPLTYRYDPTSTVVGSKLAEKAERLLEEIKQKKKNYTDFIILAKRDFNRRRGCGLLVLKYKDYPFVLKLFIETPDSFTNYQCKGIEPIFFFYMGGGVNRHLAGFTRLKNLDYVNKQLESDPYWSLHASTPRKWFWLPRKSSWFEVTGHHVGNKEYSYIKIPSMYGIIADAIEPERHFAYRNSTDRDEALKLCNFLGLYIDPNIRNFMIEKTTKKIVIVDTEHFPTIVGLRQAPHVDNYVMWFAHLMGKCAKDMLLSTKNERKSPFGPCVALS